MKTQRDILVIDDDEVVAQGVARICGSEGLSVDVADCGAAGLEQLASRVYRLVFCDIMMEGLDGLQFLAEAERRGLRAPVIMTTGYATVENAVRSLQGGAIDYLPKPFTADELMAVVRRGLNYGRLTENGAAAAQAVKPRPPQIRSLGYASWAETEPEGTVRVGVSDLFVKAMDGVRAAALLPPGAELAFGSNCATLTSPEGLAHSVLSPVSGRVLETHDDVVTNPALLDEDPYGRGWLYRVLPSELEYDLRCLSSGAPLQRQAVHRSGERP